MIHEDTFKRVNFNGAKGLIFLGDKVIAYRRDHKTHNFPGLIDLPGGGREGNESPFETFRREVVEEFGVTISQEDIVAAFRKHSYVHPGTKSFFLVAKPNHIKSKDIIFGEEGTEWFLMTAEDFLAVPDGIERQQDRVRDYLGGKLASE